MNVEDMREEAGRHAYTLDGLFDRLHALRMAGNMPRLCALDRHRLKSAEEAIDSASAALTAFETAAPATTWEADRVAK